MTINDITGGIDLVIKRLEETIEQEPPFSVRRRAVKQEISKLIDRRRSIERILSGESAVEVNIHMKEGPGA